jgi:hypothetical protein
MKSWNCSKEGEKEIRENDGGGNLTKIYYKHIYEYHNVSPVQQLYANYMPYANYFYFKNKNYLTYAYVFYDSTVCRIIAVFYNSAEWGVILF